MNQKIPIKKFSFRTIVFSAVIAGLTAIFQWIWPHYSSPALPFIVLFFFAITLLTLYILLREENGQSGKKFISSYMLSRIIKLLSCLLFLLVYVLANKKDALLFCISFISIYFLYSIFEVLILKKENNDLKKQHKEKPLN